MGSIFSDVLQNQQTNANAKTTDRRRRTENVTTREYSTTSVLLLLSKVLLYTL